MSKKKFHAQLVEQEYSFITLGPGLRLSAHTTQSYEDSDKSARMQYAGWCHLY